MVPHHHIDVYKSDIGSYWLLTLLLISLVNFGDISKGTISHNNIISQWHNSYDYYNFQRIKCLKEGYVRNRISLVGHTAILRHGLGSRLYNYGVDEFIFGQPDMME